MANQPSKFAAEKDMTIEEVETSLARMAIANVGFNETIKDIVAIVNDRSKTQRTARSFAKLIRDTITSRMSQIEELILLEEYPVTKITIVESKVTTHTEKHEVLGDVVSGKITPATPITPPGVKPLPSDLEKSGSDTSITTKKESAT